jgi:hypothetical protein
MDDCIKDGNGDISPSLIMSAQHGTKLHCQKREARKAVDGA